MIWKKKNILIVLVLVLVSSVVNADYIIGTPINLGQPINSSANEFGCCVSADGLELYFTSTRSGGCGEDDLWISTRGNKEEAWGIPVNLGSTVNSSAEDHSPCISTDGLELYFTSTRSGGYGYRDLWVSKRANKEDDWGTPINLGSAFNGPGSDRSPCISPDGLELYYDSNRNGPELWRARRLTIDSPWDTPVALIPRPLGGQPTISSDGLACVFIGGPPELPGGYGDSDLWLVRRTSIEEDWNLTETLANIVNLGPNVNLSIGEYEPYLSHDGSILYFSSNRSGGYGAYDTWQVPIIPLVDLNGSGFFDIDDLVIVIKNWDTNEPSCDIGPTPFGDGIVDKKDLEVFMSYWGQEVNDPTLIAHWPLDETEGGITQEMVADNVGLVFGEPICQLDSGIVNGALELDGIDDYVYTSFNFNPASGPFSIFAWVKGDLPYQTIISQDNGTNWLSADPVNGYLMTELKGGRGACDLISEVVITDGKWHRVGLVWTGSRRILYVDDEAVAQDTQTNLSSSEGNLIIGTASNMEIGTFWWGMIDDVLIYNRAITPSY